MFRIIIAFIFILNIPLSNAQDVTYRGLGESIDFYYTELLQTIFDHIPENKYRANRYPIEIPHQRAFEFLDAAQEIDIVIGYATNERVTKYRSIPIPTMKGLNGWRVPLVHKDNVDMFKGVTSFEEFKSFSPGLHHRWTDNKILAANSIDTIKGSNYIGLFQMLHKKRFDYFPLSVIEATREVEKHRLLYQLDILVEPNIMITYPVCFYFYVKKSNAKLANEITNGFERIVANGEYDKVFEKHHGDIFSRYIKESRQIFYLENPLLPSNVPLDREELWLH